MNQENLLGWLEVSVSLTASNDRIVLFAEELIRDEDVIPAQARFPLNRQQVAAFVIHARELLLQEDRLVHGAKPL